jgi:hypothetical protein
MSERGTLLSSRLFDLNGEVNRARKKHGSTTIVADVIRFCYAIKTDEVFDTHGHENAISHSPREVELG